MPRDPHSGVWYELAGEGAPLLVGLPLFASDVLGESGETLKAAYLAGLTDRYRVCTIDYPSIGRSDDIAPEALTADRVCRDLLSVADAAGFDRFAWFGYSWSGAAGLQLATRTDRLTALAIGGWPPIDAPYHAILAASRGRIGRVPDSAMAVLRSADQYRQWSAFYASVEGDPGLTEIACPKLVLFGANGDLVEDGHPVPIASAIRDNRPTLQAQGWEVAEVPGYGHEVAMHPDHVVALLRAFLDRAIPV